LKVCLKEPKKTVAGYGCSQNRRCCRRRNWPRFSMRLKSSLGFSSPAFEQPKQSEMTIRVPSLDVEGRALSVGRFFS
jgi:hypothetical protein